MALNDKQIRQLFKKVDPRRVKTNPQGYSYLESWDVIAHLNRIFGFAGWDKEVVESACIYDEAVTWKSDGRDKSGFDVAYRATVRLVVRDPDGVPVKISEDVSAGQAQHQPSRGDAHDLALKSAVSDAFKRAAKDLGDQYGLGLYNPKGFGSAVDRSLAYPPDPDPPAPDPEKVREEVAALRDRQIGERPETE